MKDRKSFIELTLGFCRDQLAKHGAVAPMWTGIDAKEEIFTVSMIPFMRDDRTKEMGAFLLKRLAEEKNCVLASFVSEVWMGSTKTEEEWKKKEYLMPRHDPKRTEWLWIAVEDRFGADHAFYEMIREPGKKVRLAEKPMEMPGDYSWENRFSVLAPIKSN